MGGLEGGCGVIDYNRDKGIGQARIWDILGTEGAKD